MDGIPAVVPGRTRGETAVEFGVDGELERGECAGDGEDEVHAGDGLGEAVGGVGGGRGVGAEAVVVDAVQRFGLDVEVEERCGVEERLGLFSGGAGPRKDNVDGASAEAIGLHVEAGAP